MSSIIACLLNYYEKIFDFLSQSPHNSLITSVTSPYLITVQEYVRKKTQRIKKKIKNLTTNTDNLIDATKNFCKRTSLSTHRFHFRYLRISPFYCSWVLSVQAQQHNLNLEFLVHDSQSGSAKVRLQRLVGPLARLFNIACYNRFHIEESIATVRTF